MLRTVEEIPRELLRRCGWVAGLGVTALLAVLLVLAGPADAAFPGRNGLLAVQPLGGRGIVLVKANGHGERRICADRSSECGLSGLRASGPRWSADGRALVLVESRRETSTSFVGPVVVFPDGSCAACSLSYPTSITDASFMRDSTLFTAVSQVDCVRAGGCGGAVDDHLIEFGIDEVAKKVLLSGSLSDPVWSSDGRLAVVRGGWIWVGRPGSLSRLARGHDPSWSPDGSTIVFERKSWLLVRDVRAGAARRLARGSAPAWSPDGRWIAFFDREHRLTVARARGRGVRRVGAVTGRTLDWQPIAATPSRSCPLPPGATVAARGNTATVAFDFAQPFALFDGLDWTALGCLHTNNRQRLLTESAGFFVPSLAPSPTAAAVAGHYAAMVMTTICGRLDESSWSASIDVFDLRTGTEVPKRGGESASGEVYTGEQPLVCHNDMNVVLGSDAVSAAHSTVHETRPCSCTVEQIQASDAAGVRTLDTVTQPEGSPAALTELTLTGDTLTWDHNGSPRSAQLQP